MKRKFSLDIPRLMIGAIRAEIKSPKDTFSPVALDSPPLEPYCSVRPPLPTDVDIELRTACAYVIKNFKPSTHAFETQPQQQQQSHDHGNRQQLDYINIRNNARRQADRRESGQDSSAPLSRVATRTEQPPPELEPVVESFSDKFKYKPNLNVKDLFKSEEPAPVELRHQAVSRADELMAGPSQQDDGESKGRGRAASHARSQSTPFAFSALKSEATERPKTAPRTASTGTTGSTPQTDSTDYPWSASTAMTSAVVTPAKGSNRASSSAMLSGSEASSVPKVDPVDADWMRQELEKRKKAQEEEAAKAIASMIKSHGESTATPTQRPTSGTQIPRRKPVPHSRTNSKQLGPASPVTRRSHETSRPKSRASQTATRQQEQRQQGRQSTEKKRTVTRPLHRSATRTGRPENRSEQQETVRSRAASRARSITRDVKDFFHSNSSTQDSMPEIRHDSVESSSVNRPQSRSRSVTRQVQGIFRPASRSRKQSIDLRQPETVEPSSINRSQSRSRSVTRQVKELFRPASNSRKPSIDLRQVAQRSDSHISVQSGASDMSPTSPNPSDNKWKKWTPFHRRQGSNSSVEAGRSDSLDNASIDATSVSKAKAVNLNRELPPLPSLDKWKDESFEVPLLPSQEDAAPIRDTPMSTRAPSPKSVLATKPSQHVPTEDSLGERDEILAARMGSPMSSSNFSIPRKEVNSAKGSQQSTPRVASIASPKIPSISPLEPLVFDSQTINHADLAFRPKPHLQSMNSDPLAAPPLAYEARHQRQRSKTLEPMSQSLLSGPVSPAAIPGTAMTQPVYPARAQLVNYSRVPTAGTNNSSNSNIGIARSVSVRPNHVSARTPTRPNHHARTNSGHLTALPNVTDLTSRKISADDFIGSSARSSKPSNPSVVDSFTSLPSVSAKEATVKPQQQKKKWWKPAVGVAAGSQKAKDWAEQIMLRNEEVADGPVVRY